MADVELEIIDLVTGESIGIYPLTLCMPETYGLGVGNYSFIATYLKTGERLQADLYIVEGENPPLDFTFSPFIPPCTDRLTQEECEAAGCYWYDGACHSTPEVPPIPPIDLPALGGIAVAVVDICLIGYYIITRLQKS